MNISVGGSESLAQEMTKGHGGISLEGEGAGGGRGAYGPGKSGKLPNLLLYPGNPDLPSKSRIFSFCFSI